jgi:UDP-N-acetylglucosamine 2-epimerase (non-hydrolysing)
MPEEHNRVLTDHASDLLLAPTSVAMNHLETEGLGSRSTLVGDVMTDVLYKVRDQVIAAGLRLPEQMEQGRYYVATLHRPDNTDDPARLSTIINLLATLDLPVVLLVHPRLASLAEAHGISLSEGNLHPISPLGYPQLVAAVMQSAGVVTDSGGLQKEAFLLRVPCTTIRPETEWVETVELGWNVLIDQDLSALSATVTRVMPPETAATPYGVGNAAAKVADALVG